MYEIIGPDRRSEIMQAAHIWHIRRNTDRNQKSSCSLAEVHMRLPYIVLLRKSQNRYCRAVSCVYLYFTKRELFFQVIFRALTIL